MGASTLAVGAHTINASYGGDACYGTSSGTHAHTVGHATSSLVALGGTPNPSLCGQKVDLTVTVNPLGATGTVAFFEGMTSLGSAGVDPMTGQATLSVTPTSSGTHTYTATYGGDACHSGNSRAYIQEVDPGTSSVT